MLGLLGFAMRRFGLPVLPAVIGMILGPLAEIQLRRALQISGGEVSGLFSSPLAIAVYCLIVLIIAWPLVNRFVVRRFRKPAHAVHGGHAHALVELAEELAADPENLSEDESVLARAERSERAGTGARAAAGRSESRRSRRSQPGVGRARARPRPAAVVRDRRVSERSEGTRCHSAPRSVDRAQRGSAMSTDTAQETGRPYLLTGEGLAVPAGAADPGGGGAGVRARRRRPGCSWPPRSG